MSAPGRLYDRIGSAYSATRRTDPRIAARILAALGDARTVLNVGAGTGSMSGARGRRKAQPVVSFDQLQPLGDLLDMRPSRVVVMVDDPEAHALNLTP